MSLFNSGTNIPDETPPIPEDEDRVLEKFAKWVVKKRLAIPAILFIETGRPLNYIFSQSMIMGEPIANPMLQIFFNIQDYNIFQQAMERRENVERLLLKIEKYDSQMVDWEKAQKKFLKTEKKNWKWHQRWIGISTPKITYPEELKMPRFLLEDKKDKKNKKKKSTDTPADSE